VAVLPGVRCPVLSGPNPQADAAQTLWLVPGQAPLPGSPGLSPQDLNKQGLALVRAQRWEEAAATFAEVIRLRPEDVPAHNNLGNVLKGLGRLEEAEQVLVRGTQLAPADADQHNNLGEVYRFQGRFAQALASYRAALRNASPFHPAHSNLLYMLNFDPAWDADALFEEHCRWGRLHQASPPLPYPNRPDPNRPLRVGYVSPYFRAHSTHQFIEPILRHHDPAFGQVFLYGQVPEPDAVTVRLQGLAAGWRPTAGQSAAEVARTIRQDGIDLLVDLAGHSGHGRLDVFALKPAPVQVTYLVYPNTTGLEAVDYRLTDAVIDPPGEPARATERLVYLPGGFLCFQPPEGAPEVSSPPALEPGRITFGAPHRPDKLNDQVLDVWRQVLDAVPNSRLALGRNTFGPAEAERLRARLGRLRIDPGRVTFHQLETGGGRHLRFARDIDVFLDTFPYSGHATTCEYLWMGVPVITLRDTRPAGRVSASILTTLDLPGLIAETPADYVTLAARWANDLEGLSRLRGSLRRRVSERLPGFLGLVRRPAKALQQADRRGIDALEGHGSATFCLPGGWGASARRDTRPALA
jgi:predicted O-linked N-acetylglucosamine transferase (SPINDLY family)